MKKIAVVLFVFVFGIGEVSANEKMQELSKYLAVDLNEELPSYSELQKKYLVENRNYDRRYKTHHSIGDVFDELFVNAINFYGGSEQRIVDEQEEYLLDVLAMVPSEAYQYIGPLLHTVPGMSEKILNMPGIKETKNKFPERIAPELAHIENLEFMSPHLYFVLMPELWSKDRNITDKAVAVDKSPPPVMKYDPDYMDNLKKIVSVEEFYPDGEGKKVSIKSNLRTINPDKSTNITTADIKAFVRTLDKLKEFSQIPGHLIEIYKAGLLLDLYEKDKGSPAMVGPLKDMVHPCKRLAQKIKLAGLDREFDIMVSGEGFNLSSWAYTCDKTIAAYRKSIMSTAHLKSVNTYRSGFVNEVIDGYSDRMAIPLYASMQAFVEMYGAPIEDVLEVIENREELNRKFKEFNYYIMSAPVVLQ